MVLRMTALAALAAVMFLLAGAPAVGQDKKDAKADDKKVSPEDAAKIKKALAEVQDFVGVWNLVGTPKDGTKKGDWKEKVSWGWKFKGEDAWLVADFGEGKGKYFTAGALRYDPAKKKYVLTMTAADKTEQVFEGELKAGELKAERKDAKTGDVYRVTLNTAAEGIRFQVKLAKQDGGKGAFSDVFFMNGDKDGEKLAGGGGPKKPECIVSGGAATTAVQHGGKTYYVCCSGCLDEFKANPDKYIKAKK